jgi:hypothetical protein
MNDVDNISRTDVAVPEKSQDGMKWRSPEKVILLDVGTPRVVKPEPADSEAEDVDSEEEGSVGFKG